MGVSQDANNVLPFSTHRRYIHPKSHCAPFDFEHTRSDGTATRPCSTDVLSLCFPSPSKKNIKMCQLAPGLDSGSSAVVEEEI